MRFISAVSEWILLVHFMMRFISLFSDVLSLRFKTAFYQRDSTVYDPILDPKTHQIAKFASNPFPAKSHF